jgi:hypothetical protein
MMASEGGRRKGDEDTVVVIRDRRTFVRGSTAKGAGRTIFSGWCRGVDGGRWRLPLRARFPEGEDRLGVECNDRVDPDASRVVL